MEIDNQEDYESASDSETTQVVDSLQPNFVSAASIDGLQPNSAERCRICLEDIDLIKDLDNVISPCRCAGSSALMHIKCYRACNKDRCDVCKFRIKFFAQETVDQLVHARHVLDNLVNEIQEIPETVREPVQPPVQPELQFLAGGIHDIPINFEQFLQPLVYHPAPRVHDVFDQVVQMLPMFPNNINGINFQLITRQSIDNARKFWLNIESIRVLYFFYQLLGEIFNAKTNWFILNMLLMTQSYAFMISLVSLKTCIVKTYNMVYRYFKPITLEDIARWGQEEMIRRGQRILRDEQPH
jgi:hypothetical protein